MKKPCNRQYIIICIAVFALLLWALGNPQVTNAQDQSLAEFGSSNEEIRISSDNLTVDNEARFAEFHGKVKASQGKDEIRADKLRIYYKSNLAGSEEKGSGQDEIEKIVANGNVKIRFNDIHAITNEAIYRVKEQVLVLNGNNSKVTRGNDSISGAKITVSRIDGKINIQGAKKSRVEAVFYPGKKQ